MKEDVSFQKQYTHWDNYWKQLDQPELPSSAAMYAARKFQEENITEILELGGGNGRDTLYFARQGIRVHVLEYTENGVKAILQKAEEEGLSSLVMASQHDVKMPLPFDNGMFQGCYSHMLYCMAFTEKELMKLSEEIKRVLQTGGINVYTARNVGDPMYKSGVYQGENLYEINGFVIHFFDNELIERLAIGYRIEAIRQLEEGPLPKRLSQVVLQKM